MMQLQKPQLRYKESYLAALEEAKDEIEVIQIYKPKAHVSFEAYLQELQDHERGSNLPPGWVSETVFWLIDHDEFIGRASIRHKLTPFLLQIGGHIGYFIRPSKRKQGYGKMILKLALVEAKKLGITNVLITCDETNIGSKKIIEENGGVFENSVPNGNHNPSKRRYWINLA